MKMRATAKCLRLFLPLVLLLVCTSASAAPSWLRLSAKEFTIYTDAPRRDLEKFALTYGAFRQVSRDLLLKPGQTSPHSTILLFRWDTTFKKHLQPPQNRQEQQIEWASFISEIDGLALTALSLSGDRDEALSTIFEFESVRMLRRQNPFLPLWLIQGSGQVLSSLNVGKNFAVLGEQPIQFFRHTTLRWDRFFDVTTRSPEYRGHLDPGDYHAQAWSLMHWVLLGGENSRERLERVIRECASISSGKNITRVLDCPIENLDREIYRHLADRKTKREISFDRATFERGWTIAPAAAEEVEIYRIELLTAGGKADEARLALLNLASSNPDNPLVQEALARAALRDGDQSAVSTHYRRAVELGSLTPTSLLRSASARLDESQHRGADIAGNAGTNAAEAIAEIEKALVADPANLDAYRLLGRALFMSPKITEADLERLAPGIGPGDQGAHVRFYRALLYRRLAQPNKADDDLRKIIADPDVSESNRDSAQAQLSQKARR